MFLDELTPLFRELASSPGSFLGGFFSGFFRLNLMEDPVKSWLDQQSGVFYSAPTAGTHNGKGNGPQSISID